MGKKSSSLFKNKSLESVIPTLVGQMVKKYSVILRRLSDERSEEVRFNRFLNNTNVTYDRLIEHHWSKSDADFTGKHLLLINDTTTTTFSSHTNREYLGYITHITDKKEGFHLHPSLLVDAEDGGCYGLGGVTTHRDFPTKIGTKRTYKSYCAKPFTENEKYKWFASPAKAVKNCPGAAKYTLVGDRDSDIYELICMTLAEQWNFLYRSKHNRKIEGALPKLHDVLDSWQVRHRYTLDLRATKKRSAHEALLGIKYGKVDIQRPAKHPNKSLPDSIEVNVIEVREDPATVIDNQPPVHWILLTSHPVENLESVLQIINWYRWRWIIEQLFRTAKSKGLNIENAQLKTFHGLANLATLALLAAVQVIQLVQAREGGTNQRIEDVFDDSEQVCLKALIPKLEGKTKKLKNPHPEISLAYAAWIIARLGGWKGYKSERPPGPITMTNGLIRFHSIMEGFNLIS